MSRNHRANRIENDLNGHGQKIYNTEDREKMNELSGNSNYE